MSRPVNRELFRPFDEAFSAFGPDVVSLVQQFLTSEGADILRRIAASEGSSTSRPATRPSTRRKTPKEGQPLTPIDPASASRAIRPHAPSVVFAKAPTGRGGRIEKDHRPISTKRPSVTKETAPFEMEHATLELATEDIRVDLSWSFRRQNHSPDITRTPGPKDAPSPASAPATDPSALLSRFRRVPSVAITPLASPPRHHRPSSAPVTPPSPLYRPELLLNARLAALDQELRRLEGQHPTPTQPQEGLAKQPPPNTRRSDDLPAIPSRPSRHISTPSFGRGRSPPSQRLTSSPEPGPPAYYDGDVGGLGRVRRAPSFSFGTPPSRSSALQRLRDLRARQDRLLKQHGERQGREGGGEEGSTPKDTESAAPDTSPTPSTARPPAYDPAKYQGAGWEVSLDRLKRRVRGVTSFSRDSSPSRALRDSSNGPSLLDISYSMVEPRAGRGTVSWRKEALRTSAAGREESLMVSPLLFPSTDSVLPRHPSWAFGTASRGSLASATRQGEDTETDENAPSPPLLYPNYDLLHPNLGGSIPFEGYAARQPSLAQTEAEGADGHVVTAGVRRAQGSPGPAHYDAASSWLASIARHIPGPVLKVAVQGAGGLGKALEWTQPQLLLELSAAYDAVRPRLPAWTFAPPSVLGDTDFAERLRAVQGGRLDLGFSLDLNYGVVKRRPGPVPSFDHYAERETEVERLERLRRKDRVKAEPLRYSVQYGQVESRAPVAVIGRYEPRGEDEGPPTEGPRLPYDVQRGLEALRTRKEPYVDFERQGGREIAVEPRPLTLHLPFTALDADLPIRHRTLQLVDMDRGREGDEAPPDPVDARRGPGMYPDRYKMGADAFAADFSKAPGRPEAPARGVVIREGDVLDLEPDDRVARPRPPHAFIQPEGTATQAPVQDLHYSYDLDVIRPKRDRAPDFATMLPRTEPRREPTSELADVPLAVLAQWPKGPARGGAPDFSKVSGRPEPTAASPSQSLSALDVDRGLQFLRPAHHTTAPDLTAGGARSAPLDGRNPRDAELSSWLDYSPQIDLTRPKLSESRAFDRYSQRPDMVAKGAQDDFRTYDLERGERLVYPQAPAVAMRPETVKRATPESQRAEGVTERPPPPKLPVPEPFSLGPRRFRDKTAAERVWAEPPEREDLVRGFLLTRPSAPRAAFALAEEDAHPVHLFKTPDFARVTQRDLPPVKPPPSRRLHPVGTVSDYAQMLKVEKQRRKEKPKQSRVLRTIDES